MLLAIDIGNTNIVLGLMNGSSVVHSMRLSSQIPKTIDEAYLDIRAFLNASDYSLNEIEDVILSSVVPRLGKIYSISLEKLLNKKPLVVGSGIKTGLNIRVDNPSSVGADLVVAAVGALTKYKPPLVIFDLGTATTVSVIDENACFIGGQILAGLSLSLQALATQTAQLPFVDLDQTTHLISKNTVDCIRAGQIFGHAAMMDGILSRIEDELKVPVTPICTGGLLSYILPHCQRNFIREDYLIFLGLSYIYQKNKENR